MKIRPFRTLPLRVRLKSEGFWNARSSSLFKLGAVPPQQDTVPFGSEELAYLEIEIHPYALLGHQVSSWIAGYLWSVDLGLKYIGGDLSKDSGNLFDFPSVISSAPQGPTKRIRLRWVPDERDINSREFLARQVARARKKFPNRVLVFRIALDPARWDQVPAQDVIREAIKNGYKGEELASKEMISDYVAIHIRRGSDIHENHISGKEQVNRWVLEEWYVDLVRALRLVPTILGMEIRIYALGEPADFPLLTAEGVTLKLGGDRDSDLVEMVAARLLVLSPSSFSFTAALASQAPILGRVPWWHHIPDSGRWIHAQSDGSFDRERLDSVMKRAD